MNSVCLMGRLTRDPELRMTPSGTSVCTIGLAVDRAGDMVDGVPGTGFFDVTFWGKTADNVSRYFSKGRMIAVTGELRHHRWEQEGQKRSKVEGERVAASRPVSA